MTEAVKIALIVSTAPTGLMLMRVISTFFHRRWQRGEQEKEHAAHRGIGEKVDGILLQLNGGVKALIEETVRKYLDGGSR